MDRSVSGAHRRSSMEGMSSEKKDKQPAAPTLPAFAEKQQQPPASRPPFLHISVQHVNQWTLTHAVAVSIGFAVAIAYYALVVTHYPSRELWLLLPRAATEATNADATQLVSIVQLVTGTLWCSASQAAANAEALALMLPCHRWRFLVLVTGMLWCSAPQAVAAALALLLPRHRRRVLRRAAAYTALALTVASHCMFAGALLVVVRADPELGLFFPIMGSACIFICAVGDLLGFLALLCGGEDDDDLLGFLRGREE